MFRRQITSIRPSVPQMRSIFFTAPLSRGLIPRSRSVFDELDSLFPSMNSPLDLTGPSWFMRGLDHPLFPSGSFVQELLPSIHTDAHAYDTHVDLELELPRYTMEDVQISANEKTGEVTIRGDRSDKTKGASGNRVSSRGTGSVSRFQRSFTLSPKEFNLAKVESKMEDGVLRIKIPRSEESIKALEAGRNTAAAADVAVQQPKIKTEFDGKPQPVPAATNSVSATTPSSNSKVQAASPAIPTSWPPRFQLAETPNGQTLFTISCELPEAVPASNVRMQVHEGTTAKDPSFLELAVMYKIRNESERGYSEHSASFSRNFQLPAGTKKEHVKGNLEKGKLTITVQNVAPQAAEKKEVPVH